MKSITSRLDQLESIVSPDVVRPQLMVITWHRPDAESGAAIVGLQGSVCVSLLPAESFEQMCARFLDLWMGARPPGAQTPIAWAVYA